MKKMRLLSILLVCAMLIALLAGCGAADTKTPAAEEKPAAEAAPEKTDAAPAASGESDAAPVAAGGKVGYIDDEVDHFARDPYKFAYLCGNLGWVFNRAISDKLAQLGKILNYEYTEYDCNNDFDAYIAQISTFAANGYDGVIMGTDDALCKRAIEVAMENGLQAMGESTALKDFDGIAQGAAVTQDQYANGYITMQWLVDHYADYWKEDIKGSANIGLIPIDFSGVSGIMDRVPGMTDAFAEAFPESKDNVFECDLVSLGAGFSIDSAYQLVSSALTTNPQIEKWFIIACVDDWAQGATRATEAAGMEDKVLVSCVQGNAFVNELSGGYDGNVWVSCCYVPERDFAEYMAAGLVALCDGRATRETLWPEYIEEGDVAATMKLPGVMLTKDTYQDFLKSQEIVVD